MLTVTAVVLLLGSGYGYWALRRPLPVLQPVAGTVELRAAATTSSLLWPTTGQAAVSITDSPILETHGTMTPAPTASTAKLITALVVLNAKPLDANQPGPTLTLTASDVALYNSYVAQDGSVVPVQAGEQISEYQVLQTLLLPSANNMADSLAIWAFGSLPAYKVAATSYLARHGLTDTHIGSDASGFSPTTTSTASDLVKLGTLALQNPVLAQIVSQSTASGIPDAGTIKNVNSLLGTDGIIGIKTGNTNQAGGVFVSASRVMITDQPTSTGTSSTPSNNNSATTSNNSDNQDTSSGNKNRGSYSVTIVTAEVDQPSLADAMKTSQSLIRSAQTNFKPARIITAATPVDSYIVPWGSGIHKHVQAIASQNLTVTTWVDSTAPAALAQAKPFSPNASAGQIVGTITTAPSSFSSPQSISLKLQTAIPKPAIWWRLTHPL